MKRFKKILYISDSTDDQAWAVERAASLAENNQAELTVAAMPPGRSVAAGSKLSPDKRGFSVDYEHLEPLVKSYQERLSVRLDVLEGNRIHEVVRAVSSHSYDLVIKPAENPSWLERLFGNNDMSLLRQCPCPVWLMKPRETSDYKCILATVDFDPLDPLGRKLDLNLEILERASLLALANSASLHFVHAWEAIGEKTLLSRSPTSPGGLANYVEKTRAPYNRGFILLGEELSKSLGDDTYDRLSPRFHLPKGAAAKMIPMLAAELQADLVVMGTVARTGISGLFIGNTAEEILDQLRCSVLAIKPPEFKTSVKAGVKTRDE